ncbi:hypothetical protein HPB49_002285 [Dermacentor silvarum]|uniref:Uncharacterized protein n=1 Tax=Dermacentor silvarum TaxID=543639 RepID=A0ACB8DIM2_DERSI|nr:hypothetical protein HPB49_002285 [Dermacentor silvarum]
MTEARNSGHTPPAFTSFGDEAIPSTSCEDAVGSSSTLDSYTRISGEAWAYPWNMLNSLTDATYVTGHPHMNENGSTSYGLSMSRWGDNDAKLSTSHAHMEESAATSEDDARIPHGTWGGDWNTQYCPANVTSPNYGYTDIAENGSTGYWTPVSSSGGDEVVPSTSRAGMEEASASLENYGRNATGTEENEQKELCGVCGVCGTVYTRLHALHRHAAEHYGDESYTCDACDLPSVQITKLLGHFQKSTKEKLYKCETCGMCIFVMSEWMATKHCGEAAAPKTIEWPTKKTMLASGGTSDRTMEKEGQPISGGHETTGTRNEQREADRLERSETRVRKSLVSRSVSSASRPQPESLDRARTIPTVPGEIRRA